MSQIEFNRSPRFSTVTRLSSAPDGGIRAARRFVRRGSFRSALLLLLLLTALVGGDLHAQQVRSTDYKADQSLKSNARVNPSTRAMELSIPLVGYAGRAGTGLPVTLNYSSKLWQVEAFHTYWTNYGGRTSAKPIYAKRTAAGWTSSLGAPRIDAQLKIYEGAIENTLNEGQIYVDDMGQNPPQTRPLYYVKRVQVIMPDGAAHEFRASDEVIDCGTTTGTGCAADLTGTYLSVDASAMRLEYSAAGSTLYLPDGTRYLFGAQTADHRASAMIDRHGNRLNYNQGLRRWTDTLGRTIDDPLPYTIDDVQNQTVGDQTAHFPGMGATYDVTFSWRLLKDPNGGESGLENPTQQALRNLSDLICDGNLTHSTGVPYLFYTPDISIAAVCDSFSYSAAGTNWQTAPPFNPVVMTKIALPNGQAYEFKYNRYGEITRIVYPTGAVERLEYETVAPLQWQGFTYDQTNRGVRERWVSAKGDGTDDLHWSYGTNPDASNTFVTGTETAPTGIVTEQLLHTEPSYVPQPYGFGSPRTGRPYETRIKTAGGVLLSRQLTAYEWTGWLDGNRVDPTRDLRPKREVTVTFEPGDANALATLTEFTYEVPGENNAPLDPKYFAALNVRQTKSYHYLALPATDGASKTIDQLALLFAGATPAAITEKDYKYDANYQARNINGLVTETRIKDGSGVVKAKSQIDYDEALYSLSSSGTMPTAAANSWIDLTQSNQLGATIGSKRGLPTTVKSYSDLAVNANSFIETHTYYDQYGNVRKTRDGRGNETDMQYDVANAFAYPTKTISPIPGGSGSTTAFETTTAYDYNTGLPTFTTDANNQTTQISYADPVTNIIDPLLRVRKVTAPNGHQTITEYGAGTSAATRYVKTRTQIDETKWKEGYAWFDGLGRGVKSQSVDSNGDVFALTCYDQYGRAEKVSNPFRNVSNATCASTNLEWTTTVYDAATGRAWKTITPDNAVVEMNYALATTGNTFGTAVTVKDQALKERRSITNALGQIKRVDEPTDTGGLGAINSPNQPTYYDYDTLSNLTTVTQGVQTRTFAYNSLSRLKSATNPELGVTTGSTHTPGTIIYAYDENGNLTSKLDPRGVKTNYVYDALNRATSRTYTNSSGGTLSDDLATPTVTYAYDNLPNAKGKLTKVTTTGTGSNTFSAATDYQVFDEMGRVRQSRQTVDGVIYGTSPQIYVYNLSGALVEQTYPSGRVVKNALDADGDLAAVKSKKNAVSGPFWNYADNFTYTAAGAVSSMRFGNGRWESTIFNSRLQPTQIALGTTQNGTDKLKLNYTYNTTNNNDNNGNVLSQTITVPTETRNNTTYAGFTATQNYTYDALNRLHSAEELIPTQTGWKQTFKYDRYGNRNFDYGANPTSNPQTTTPSYQNTTPKVVNPEVLTTNNRFKQDQDNDSVPDYLYDAAGNTTRDVNNKKFTYDGENHQTKVETVNSSGTVTGTLGEYYYDGDGKRVKKKSATETTIFIYDAAGKLVAEYANQIATATAQVSYLTSDHLGSPRINTDQNGKVIARHDYQPFGEEVTRTSYGGDDVRKQFTAYERDIETDLDFAQARYYKPSHGRYTSVDPLMASADIVNPQTFNRYVYVGNNPVNITDPTGLIWGTLDGLYVWYKNQGALDAAGATTATVFYGVIQGTTQLAVLNPNANQIAQVASATAALEQLAAWGAGAAALEATAIALGVVATGVAAKASADALGKDANCMMDPAGCNAMQGMRLYNEAQEREMEELKKKVPPVEDGVETNAPNPNDNEPSTPVGRRGNPINAQGNAPTNINGRDYSGHAIDRMQGRGVPPSAVENTIKHGNSSPGNRPGTTVYHDPVNKLSVVTNSSGKVISVITKRK